MGTLTLTFPTQAEPTLSDTILLSENVLGLSRTGSFQFTAGEIITDSDDRRRVAEAAFRMLRLADDGQSLSGYFPGNTKYTPARLTRAAQDLMDYAFQLDLALRFKGAWQFLAAEPVTNPLDRKVLSAILIPVASNYSDIELITANSPA
jgi:hypothetical protein